MSCAEGKADVVPSSASPAEAGGRLAAVLGMVSSLIAVVLATAMAVRPIGSFDIGYHLAYGDHFLETGRIVQTNRFIYTRLDNELLRDPANIGPGCRYDEKTGTYYFVNANWLSQIVMSLVHRWGGMNGLVVLQAALVAGVFLVLAWTLRRGGVPWPWVAPALLLATFCSYGRFPLRPEVFGYLVLVAQLCVLVGPHFGWRRALALTGLQVLAVNVHSYFLLGIALSGAFLVAAALRWLWARWSGEGRAGSLARAALWLAAATGGTVLACLANPWPLRGALMPIQTVLFLRKYVFVPAPAGGSGHPWAAISELFPPFSKDLRSMAATTAYKWALGVAALAVLAGLADVVRRLLAPPARPARAPLAWMFALAGMTYVSFQANRNIAMGAMLMVPLSAMIIARAWEGAKAWTWWARLDRPAARLALAAAAASAALGVWWTFSVATQRFYFADRRSWRFGLGPSRVFLPMDAAEWINAHRPAGRIFCDYNTSSNLLHFTRPQREMPALTNTWAYPPYVMRWVLDTAGGKSPLDPVVTEYDVGTAVLMSSGSSQRLISKLARDREWAVVNVGATYIVFVRGRGPNAALAAEHGLREATFDVEEFMARLSRQDPVPAYALHNGAQALWRLGWSDHAAAVWRRAIEMEPDYDDAMEALAMCLWRRGGQMAEAMQRARRAGRPAQAEHARRECIRYWTETGEMLQRVLKLKPGRGQVAGHLKVVRSRLAQLQALDAGAPTRR